MSDKVTNINDDAHEQLKLHKQCSNASLCSLLLPNKVHSQNPLVEQISNLFGATSSNICESRRWLVRLRVLPPVR